LQIDRHGRILRIEGSEYLPFLLGRAAHLPLEPLSPLNENPWTVATDVAISLNHEDWLSNTVFATMRKELLPARKKATYKIVGRDGELITVSKSYELATAAESDGKPRVSLVGEGTLKFDPQAGVFKSSEMKLRAAVRESGTTVEFPVEISYNMPSEAEMAEMNAKLETARQEAEQRAKERLTPITPDEMEQLIKNLQSSDPAKTRAAVTRLTDKQPQEPNGKLAATLEEMLKSDTPKIRENAARVMEVWAAPENIPSLKKLLDDDSTTIRRSALKALGQLKATEAIDRIIEQWPKDSIPVSAALRAMGEAAEPAVLKLLETSGNNRVRRDACRVLGEIGTEKSLAALEKIEKDADRSMQLHARMALSNLRRKLGKD
ncbi:MAG: HEAT repeat domain-containing protein, partial [Pirellulaceae bacterium]|nr:HEAT repeat domain-containing protein [Pirellulaceae bacterium]